MIVVPTIVAVAGLVTTAVVILGILGVPTKFGPLVAVLRAAVQLGLLGLVLQGLITDLRWIALALTGMNAVAIGAAGRRIQVRGIREWLAVAAAVPAGALTAGTIVFATGALEADPTYILAFGGIVTGNAMSITSLAGRGFLDRVGDGWDEVEAWLALGARKPYAVRRFLRLAAARALMPSVDQARTTGLVTLPGAFIGAVFGGASPLEAARFQLIVSSGIMAAGAVSTLILLAIMSRVAVRPAPSQEAPVQPGPRPQEAPQVAHR